MPAPTAVTKRLDGRQRMCCVAKGLGRSTEGTKETAPHSLAIAESRLASNFLDWQPALLEHERLLGDRRVGFEPSGNIDRSICIESAIEVLGDVADVRRREDVVQLPEGVIGRQRLHVEYIDRCASDSARLQRLDQGRLIDDRTP